MISGDPGGEAPRPRGWRQYAAGVGAILALAAAAALLRGCGA